MSNDIREIIKDNKSNSMKLSDGHRNRFEARLRELHSPNRKKFTFLKIAASIVFLISIGYIFIHKDLVQQTDSDTKVVDLGTISPEMKQIENYYLMAINYEMANLETTPQSKTLLDTYLKKITELTNQYKEISNNLTENEINEKTINTLITNLQLRLQLLIELKDTMQELNTPKTINNETSTI